jgi:NAD(P)-dependent dehydrogenase (short-subunit alcohol dehydrogenase family)
MKDIIIIAGASRGNGAATTRLAARLGSPGEYVDYAA